MKLFWIKRHGCISKSKFTSYFDGTPSCIFCRLHSSTWLIYSSFVAASLSPYSIHPSILFFLPPSHVTIVSVLFTCYTYSSFMISDMLDVLFLSTRIKFRHVFYIFHFPKKMFCSAFTTLRWFWSNDTTSLFSFCFIAYLSYSDLDHFSDLS